MKINIKANQIRIFAEGYILIKYGVITDAITFVRHTVNRFGESITAVTNGVTEISEQLERTTGALNYQTETVAASFNSADATLLKMALTVILIMFVLYKFQIIPFILAAFSGATKAKSGATKAKSGATKAKSGATKAKSSAKAARFNKWVSRYGKDYRTKKEAQQAFTAFEKDMGYN